MVSPEYEVNESPEYEVKDMSTLTEEMGIFRCRQARRDT